MLANQIPAQHFFVHFSLDFCAPQNAEQRMLHNFVEQLLNPLNSGVHALGKVARYARALAIYNFIALNSLRL